MTDAIWTTIHNERSSLAGELEGRSDAEWATPSLSSEWTVREMLAHMTATAALSPLSFLAALAKSGFKFPVFANAGIAAHLGATPSDTLANFTKYLKSSSHPPGPVDSWLGETIVHGEDIRRVLHIKHDYPMDALVRSARFYAKSNLLIGGKTRAAGLTWKATDADMTFGSGPTVSGPVLAIVLAITGRGVALPELSGDGLDILRARF